MDNKRNNKRRPLIMAAITIAISMGVAVWLHWQYRDIDRCLDQGGRWNEAKQVCEMPR